MWPSSLHIAVYMLSSDLEVGGSSLTGHVVFLDKDILLGGNPSMD